MRPRRHFLTLLLLLTVCLALHGQEAAPPPAVASAKIAVPNVFSYQPPVGWVAVRLNGLPYPVAMEKKGGTDAGLGFTPAMITVNVDDAPLTLNEWCTKSLGKNKAQFAAMNAQIGELEAFSTAAGVSGFRAPIDLTAHGRNLHYVMYFFAGAANAKLAVTCACAAPDAPRYSPIFEAAMKTFAPY